MREVRAAVAQQKRLVLMRETDMAKGGLTVAQATEAAPEDLRTLLFGKHAQPLIAFHRVGEFQIVSLLSLLRRLVPPRERHEALHVADDALSRLRRCRLQRPRAGCLFHVYCSKANAGAAEALSELSSHARTHVRAAHHREPPTASSPTAAARPSAAELLVSSDVGSMAECEQFALYLDSRTWISPSATTLAAECVSAMRAGIPIILLFECDEDVIRFATPFASIIQETPSQLLEWKIYAPIACTLAGGEHRPTSLALALLSLMSGRRQTVRVRRPEVTDEDDRLQPSRACQRSRAATKLSIGMDALRRASQEAVRRTSLAIVRQSTMRRETEGEITHVMVCTTAQQLTHL